MTILAIGKDHLVEYESGMFSIARRDDGHCVAIFNDQVIGTAGEFRKSMRKKCDGVEGAIERFIKLARCMGSEWEPLYTKRGIDHILEGNQ